MILASGNVAEAMMTGGDGLETHEDPFEAVVQDNEAVAEPLAREAENADRRSAVRFPIEREVRYKVFSRNTIETGSGKTVNMSSNGVLFTTERTLNPGERLEVAVNWPAHLDNKCPLKLVTAGRVVRSEGDRAAIAIERYEFRTQGSRGM
jgi:hypothetical protein